MPFFGPLRALPIAATSLLLSAGLALAGSGPTASAPYTLATFKGAPPTGATSADDIAVSADGTALWVGYGDGACTFGPSGIGSACPTGTPANSNLVEYDTGSGAVLQNFSIPGHLDGLKINPQTGDVWATQNEDGNPTLIVLSPKQKKPKIQTYSFISSIFSSAGNGGMDDLVFGGPKFDETFFTLSSQTATALGVIGQISGSLKKSNTNVLPVENGNPASVLNVVTGLLETTDQIGDPDSMTVNPAGELVLDDRGDNGSSGSALYIFRGKGSLNPILRVPLTDSVSETAVEVDDTIFTYSLTSQTSSTAGTLYFTDTTSNTVYTLTKPYFSSNEVYAAENKAGVIGLVDLNTGVVTPVVTGLGSPRGLAFAATSVAFAPATTKK